MKSLSVALQLFLCTRSVEKDEVSLYSIAALILKHEGKTSDVLI